jgi:hypothetical protein
VSCVATRARLGVRLGLEHLADRRRDDARRARPHEAASCGVSVARALFGDPDRDVDRDDLGVEQERVRKRLAAERIDDPVVLEHDHGQRAAGEIDACDAYSLPPLRERDHVSIGIAVGRRPFVRLAHDFRAGGYGARVCCDEVVDPRSRADLHKSPVRTQPPG